MSDVENEAISASLDDSSAAERSILVTDVPEDLEDALESLVENKRRGGGKVTKFVYDKENRVASITFEDPKVAEYFLKSEAITLQNRKMRVLKAPDDHTLFIRNVVSNEMNELLEIFLESPKKGGGPFKDYNFDESAEIVTVSFEDKHVAENFLQRQFIEIRRMKYYFSKLPPCVNLTPSPGASNEKENDTYVIYSREEEEKEQDKKVEEEEEEQDKKVEEEEQVEDGEVVTEDNNREQEILLRSIYILEVPPAMIDFLEIILTQEKSGGGNIERMVPDEETEGVLVTFEDPEVARRLLEAGKVSFGSNVLTVEPPPSKFSRKESTEENVTGQDLPSATLVVAGIPRNMTRDSLLVLLESEQIGGGDVIDLKYENGREQAVVQFEDYTVAQNLLQVGHGQYKEIKLSFSPVEEEEEVAEDTVEIRGVPASVSKSVLHLFLENKKRSGGGDVESLEFNESRGIAVVQFKDVEVAKSMLERGTIKYRDIDLEVRRCAPLPPGLPPGRVEFLDVPSGTKINTLTMFLENKKRSGGGAIVEEDLVYDENSGRVLVTFKDPLIAEEMLKKGELSFNKSTLRVRKPMSDASASSAAAGESSGIAGHQVMSRTVEITGCLKDLGKEKIELFFENNKRSSGGPLDDVQILSEDSAILVFKNAEDAVRVAQKGKHRVYNATLSSTLLDSWPDIGGPRSIKVRGLKKETSVDMIGLYFENLKRSGGDVHEEIFYDSNQQTAVIVFSGPEVVKRVLQQKHILEGAELKVEALKPSRPPPLLRPEDVDGDKLLFTELEAIEIHVPVLKKFVEDAGKAPVKSITFSVRPGMALVLYGKFPDYQNVMVAVSSRPFQGKMISVQRVPISKSIQVCNIGPIIKEMLEMYFESPKKSGGGNLNVQIFEEKSHAIIEFEDQETQQKVLERKHVLSDQQLEVKLYIPVLGMMPAGFNGSLPVPPIPPDFTVDCDEKIVSFYLKTQHQKKHIEHHLKKRRCFVKWPMPPGKVLTLHCTAQPTDPKVHSVMKDWRAKCEGFLREEFKGIDHGEIDVLQEIWKSFKDRLIAVSSDGRLLLVEFDENRRCVAFSGVFKQVEEFGKQALDAKKTLEAELEKQKREIKESFPVKPPHLFLLKATGLLDKERKDVRLEVTDKNVLLIGQPQAVKPAKLEILQFCNSFVEKILDRKSENDLFEKVLSKTPTKYLLQESFGRKKITASYDVRDRDVTVVGVDQTQVDLAVELIVSEFVESSMKLDEVAADVVRREDWKDYKASLLKDYQMLEMTETKSSIVFVTKKGSVPAITKKVEDFIGGNAIYDKFLPFPRGLVEVLKKYDESSSSFDHLKSSLRSSLDVEVSIVLPTGFGRTGFSVKAKKESIGKAVTEVEQFARKVLNERFTVTKQGIVKNFRTEKTRDKIDVIGHRRHVVIKFEDDEEGGKEKSAQIYSDPTVQATVHLRSAHGKMIKLILGDITKDRTDCIVNAANSKLDHVGGVARAISKAAGPSMQEECKERVRKHGELRPGTVYTSIAGGTLPHKSIIHTVGPVWHGGTSNEDRDLDAAVGRAMTEADGRLYKTVSLPVISCGVYGFPEKRGSSVILKAIANFLTRSLYVNEVHVVNGRQESIGILRDCLGAIFPGDQVVTPLMSGYSSRPASAAVSKGSGEKQWNSGMTRQSSQNTGPFQTPEGVKIVLVKGSIEKQTVDVVFDSADRTLNLTKTNISKSLLVAAGSELQDACKTNYPQGIGEGEVMKTGAYKLPCQAVYHGVCAKWDRGAGNSEMIIRKLMSSSLNMAHKDGMKSIAFPPIGTGRLLKTPADVVVRLMFDEVKNFSSSVPTTRLTEVRFVIYEKDQEAVDAFEKELRSMSGHSSSSYSGGAAADATDNGNEDDDDEGSGDDVDDNGSDEEERIRDDDSDDKDGSETSHNSYDHGSGGRRGGRGRGGHHRGGGGGGGGHRRTEEPYQTSSSSGSDVAGLDCKVGDISFLVKREDITRCTTDAVVNGTNDKLNLKIGKLSRAILRAAGDGIVAELGGLLNGMAVTTGGNMSCKRIFHVTARDTKGWKNVIAQTLQHADMMRLTSISIPPVGVGRGSVTAKDLAEAIFDAVYNFSQTKPKNLLKIVISVLDQGMIEDIVSTIEKADKLQGQPFKKFWSDAKDKVKELVKSALSVDDDDENEHNGARKKRYRVQRKSKSAPDSGAKMNPTRLVLTVYGLERTKINNAIDELKKLSAESEREFVISWKHEITPVQEKNMKTLESKHGVQIRIFKDDKKIRVISDSGEDVSGVVAEIYQLLSEQIIKEKDTKELEYLAKQATWQHQEGNSMKAYGKYATGTIEKAHQAKQTSCEYTDHKNVIHKIDFKNMTDDRSPGGKVTIARISAGGSLHLPQRWQAMNPTDVYLSVTLQPTSEEYKKVETSLKTSAQGMIQVILKIERIQNPGLYRQYMNRKLDMDRTNPGNKNETRLWHGTAGNNVMNIDSRNFNRSYAGAHGTAIGNGVYFAVQASYSVRGYCPVDASRLKHIYQARVLTGKCCQGQGGLKEAPVLPGRSDATYDSVVDNITTPSMYVVFLDYQMYPEYHITFQ